MYTVFALLVLAVAVVAQSPTTPLTATSYDVSVVPRSANNPFSGQPGAYPDTFALKVTGSAAAPVSGQQITVVPGQTYTFNMIQVDAAHPFFITFDPVGGQPSKVGEVVTTPLSAIGTQTLTWTVPATATPATAYYYQCSQHNYMGGRIFVQQAVQPTYTYIQRVDNGCINNNQRITYTCYTCQGTYNAANPFNGGTCTIYDNTNTAFCPAAVNVQTYLNNGELTQADVNGAGNGTPFSLNRDTFCGVVQPTTYLVISAQDTPCSQFTNYIGSTTYSCYTCQGTYGGFVNTNGCTLTAGNAFGGAFCAGAVNSNNYFNLQNQAGNGQSQITLQTTTCTPQVTNYLVIAAFDTPCSQFTNYVGSTTYSCYSCQGNFNGFVDTNNCQLTASGQFGSFCSGAANINNYPNLVNMNQGSGQSSVTLQTTTCTPQVQNFYYITAQDTPCSAATNYQGSTTYSCYVCTGTYNQFGFFDPVTSGCQPDYTVDTGNIFCEGAVNQGSFGNGQGIFFNNFGANGFQYTTNTVTCAPQVATCYSWEVAGTSQCVGTCGTGFQTTTYNCFSYQYQGANQGGNVFGNNNCPGGVVPFGVQGVPDFTGFCGGLQQPSSQQSICQLPNACVTYQWIQGTCPPCPVGCTSPQFGNQFGSSVTCSVGCADSQGNSVSTSFCQTSAFNPMPQSIQTCPALPTCVTGDPEFVGFLQQKYEIHGVPNQVFNIITSPLLQYNALFVYIGHASERECNATRTHPWTHAGTYLGKLGFITGTDRIQIDSGDCITGVKSVLVNGKKVSVGSTVELAPRAGQPQSIVYKDQFTVIVHTAEVDITLTNSDNFFNQQVEFTAFGEQDPKMHGLLGQTWMDNGHKVIVGTSADYMVQDEDLFGTDFVFNKFISPY